MRVELFPKQAQYFTDVFRWRWKYMLYGGAIRGGKTWVTLLTIGALCKKYPGSRWAVVRRDLPTLRRNTIPSWMKIKGERFSSVNQNTWSSVYQNGSEVLFFAESIEKDPDLDRWKGLEVNGFLLEEANELSSKSFYKAMERAGTLVLPSETPPPLIMLTCNPAQGWVKQKFYTPHALGTLEPPFYYLPARADDNPHIPGEVKESWKNLPPNEYARFVEGNWDMSDDPDQLIKFEWIENSYSVEKRAGISKMGIDVARFGDDMTTFAYFIGNTLCEVESWQGLSIDKTSNYASARIQDKAINAENVGVDVVGLGAGVADNLRAQGYHVKDIISGGSPSETAFEDSLYGFANLRSQMWWAFREALRLGEVRIDVKDQRLLDDLLSVKYKMKSDKTIVIESKDNIKKRLGRSTDFGDAVVYAYFVDKVNSPFIMGFY